MQWFLARSKLPNNLWLTVCLVCVAQFAHSAEKSRLWLAKSHQKYYLQLVEAAESAEALERCEEVMEGTLDRGQSDGDHPIFRILCRQPNGVSYNEMVDGLTFETMTTPKPVVVELTAEEREVLRLEEEKRAREALARRKAEMWRLCKLAFATETRLMLDLEWLQTAQPEPQQLDDQGAVFTAAFNAKSIWGQPLEYEALCQVTDAEVRAVQLKRRP